MPIQVEERDLSGVSFRVGEWLVEPSLNRLSKGDTTIQLELKVMDVLVCLAERAGEVVPRREIVDRVWATEFISDNTLTHAVTELRNALGDDAKNPSFIETIHRRGYRLITPVEATVSDKAGESRVARFPVRERAVSTEVERSPYPGLAAFTEEDAEFFFGREEEVGRMWRKLTSRKLLAVIGPSGVGKSSFLRAGVIPARPEGWGVLVCQPGEAPFAALARALVPEFAGDLEAMAQLVDIRDGDRAVAMVSRWRDRNRQLLFVVDQFEELFTLNPSETQAQFAEVLRRLVDDADVHVLIAMRDDFLFRIHDYPTLAPILNELTLLGAPSPESLRLAVVEPARQLGFAYEDDGLPGEMIAGVESERGALPMLAFAVARLWEKRDRENRRLTREAYEDIGGVGGALAGHAESTLKAIGDERLPIVREIFRNLVTAEGTRAVREWDELLSVFDAREGIVGAGFTPARQAAEEILLRLIDARLLTSFEEEDVEGDGRRRVEVVHETLLSSWPRLVRWQTQDADAAQLRDQLRQAAKTWDERERPDDLLWTGSAFREFSVWRERYPGGLTETEEDFAQAMTDFARRRKRRLGVAVAGIFVVLLIVLGVVAASRQQAIAEARRAEAAKLLALAQVHLDTDPTEALAYATASLSLADSHDARIFSIRTLWAAPPLSVLDAQEADVSQYAKPAFSPDGRWLALVGLASENVLVYRATGGQPIILGGHAVSGSGTIGCAWSRDGLLVTGHGSERRVRVWAFPQGRLVRTIDFEHPARWQVGETHLFAEIVPPVRDGEPRVFQLRKWSLPNGEAEDLGSVNWSSLGASSSVFDPGGGAWIYAKGRNAYSCPLPLKDGVRGGVIGRHSYDDVRVTTWQRPQGLYSSTSDGEVILWTTADGSAAPGRRLRKLDTARIRPLPDSRGRWAVDGDYLHRENRLLLWDFEGLLQAQPLELRRSGGWYFSHVDFHPLRDWVVASTNDLSEVSFWPLPESPPVVVRGYETFARVPVNFTPDGRCLVTNWGQDRVRFWPMPGEENPDVVDLLLPRAITTRTLLAIDEASEMVLTTGHGSGIYVLFVNGGDPLKLEGFPSSDLIEIGAFSPSGRLVAAASMVSETNATLRVWDLETGESRVFDQPDDPEGCDGYFTLRLAFADETTLFSGGANGILRWDLESGTYEQVLGPPLGGFMQLHITSDRRRMLASEVSPSFEVGRATIHDLNTGDIRSVDISGGTFSSLSLSRDGSTWASQWEEDLIRVGRTDGGEPHLLAGHEGRAGFLSISPDRRWIASSGGDKTLRLWPMPDLSKPPLHTLPREELIAKLHSLTNLRVVRDEESSTGWKVEVGPFPGWAEVPEW